LIKSAKERDDEITDPKEEIGMKIQHFRNSRAVLIMDQFVKTLLLSVA